MENHLSTTVLFLVLVISAYQNVHCIYVNVSPESYPYNVIVKGGMYCTGALFNDQYVVTSAYCLNGTTQTNVILGSTGNPAHTSIEKEKDIQIVPSDKIIIHEDFVEVRSFQYLNDIALVKLSQPATRGKKVHPIKFATQKYIDALYDRFVDITGWKFATGDLSLVKVHLLNHDTCSFVFEDKFYMQNLCISSVDPIDGTLYGNAVTSANKILGVRLASPYVNPKYDHHKYKLVTNTAFFLHWISHHTGLSIKELTDEEDNFTDCSKSPCFDIRFGPK